MAVAPLLSDIKGIAVRISINVNYSDIGNQILNVNSFRYLLDINYNEYKIVYFRKKRSLHERKYAFKQYDHIGMNDVLDVIQIITNQMSCELENLQPNQRSKLGAKLCHQHSKWEITVRLVQSDMDVILKLLKILTIKNLNKINLTHFQINRLYSNLIYDTSY